VLGPTLRRLLVLTVALVLPLTVVSALTAPAQTAVTPPYGPACTYDTILNGQYTLIPLKNQAMITRETCGYRVRGGQQDNHLVITQVDGGLRFHDAGSAQWKSIPDACRRVSVAQGVAAWCRPPRAWTTRC
jgi:hypothetical protein